jgi:hypothetical protein
MMMMMMMIQTFDQQELPKYSNSLLLLGYFNTTPRKDHDDFANK